MEFSYFCILHILFKIIFLANRKTNLYIKIKKKYIKYVHDTKIKLSFFNLKYIISLKNIKI